MGGVLFDVGKVELQSVSRNKRWSLLTSWLADYSGGRTSSFRVEYIPFNLDQLQACAEKHGVTEITAAFLYEKGYTQRDDLVKILANGEIKTALTVTAHGCSDTAKVAIEAAGGTVTVVAKKQPKAAEAVSETAAA